MKPPIMTHRDGRRFSYRRPLPGELYLDPKGNAVPYVRPVRKTRTGDGRMKILHWVLI